MRLGKQDILDGFKDLGGEALAHGKIIDLAVYGGSCLILVSNFRDASQDIDAVASTDQQFVDRTAADIAARRNWPLDWLNDGVRVYLSPFVEPPADHDLIGTYPSEKSPGLRVYVPTAEYMLAMKLMAMRIGELDDGNDKSDIENLINVVGCDSVAALIALACRYYPEARTSAKLILSAERLLAAARERTDEAPRYLDRRGARGGDP